jgi:hypothetical protein
VRRILTGGVCALVLLAVAVPAASGGGQVVLGRSNIVPAGVGWGTAHPRLLFNGGDPNGRAFRLRWRDWGKRVARAKGLTWIFTHHGGYYSKPGAIELRAYHIGHCTRGGPRAYTQLEAREAVRPGGRLGHWFHWGGWKSICKGP